MTKKNNWYVITGSPCSGKTTILKKLQEKGYWIIEEAARTYIDQEMAKGRTLKQIRSPEINFQQKVLQMKLDIENKLPRDRTIFLERGIPDSEAYYRLCKYKDDQYLMKAMKRCFYKKVFLFEQLDYQKDYARIESKETAQMLEHFLEESYREVGTTIIKVPKMSTEERLQFILTHIN